MRKIIQFIFSLINSFPPQDFKGDWYAWMKNQFSHTCMNYVACIYFTLLWKYAWVILLVFWLLWEVRHLVLSKNYTDFIEDLYFLYSGVLLYIVKDYWFGYVIGIIYITSLIVLTIKKRIAWQ